MLLVLSFFVFIVGSFMSASFALPMKIIKGWQFENIFLNYSFWTFFLFPWLMLFIIAPHAVTVYFHTPISNIIILCVGGFLFGIGQVSFALSMRLIGFGIGFILNVGIGTGLGFILPLLFIHPSQMFTTFGIFSIIGVLLICLGLVYCFIAGSLRDKEDNKEATVEKDRYLLGVALGCVAGIFYAAMNFAFAETMSLSVLAASKGIPAIIASNIAWPIFLTAAFIPYVSYMLYLHVKNRSYRVYTLRNTARYLPVTFIMGTFSYGSIVAYGYAVSLIGKLGPVIGWPLFMVLVILISNYWGWYFGEWRGCDRKTVLKIKWGIFLLVAAVVVLAFSLTLAH